MNKLCGNYAARFLEAPNGCPVGDARVFWAHVDVERFDVFLLRRFQLWRMWSLLPEGRVPKWRWHNAIECMTLCLFTEGGSGAEEWGTRRGRTGMISPIWPDGRGRAHPAFVYLQLKTPPPGDLADFSPKIITRAAGVWFLDVSGFMQFLHRRDFSPRLAREILGRLQVQDLKLTTRERVKPDLVGAELDRDAG